MPREFLFEMELCVYTYDVLYEWVIATVHDFLISDVQKNKPNFVTFADIRGRILVFTFLR